MNRTTESIALFSITTPLPKSAVEPPEWITLFPSLGNVKTRDGRAYSVDGATLVSAFKADGIDIPIDINHSTDAAAPRGERSDAIGWISRLRVVGNALQGKVDWLAEGKELLARRSYRFVSPSFFHTSDKRATRLKAVALVTAPAIANQAAIAAGRTSSLLSVSENVIYGAVSTPLPQTYPLPDWVVVFPALGFVETQSGQIFYIDGKAICEDFDAVVKETGADFREFPVNVDHRPDIAVDRGEDAASPPIGAIGKLRIESGRLEALVEWSSDAARLTKNLIYG